MSFSFSVTPGVRIRPAQARSAHRGSAQQRLTHAEKQLRATELSRAIHDVLNLHRQPFPAATRPQAPPPPPVDRAALAADHRRWALRQVGLFQFGARRRALATAKSGAEQHIAQLEAQRQHQWQQAQHDLDRWWAALLRNDPPVVLGVLAEAFEDNEAPATATGVAGSEACIVALVPGVDSMPQHKPDTTAAGNLTLRKLTKTERAELHTAAVASHVLRTVREAFAVAPGLSAARIVALQPSGADTGGGANLELLLAARFERHRLDGVQWDQVGAASILQEASSELLMNVRQATGELRPLDLRREPDLATVLDHLDLDESPSGEPRTRPLPMATAAVPVPGAVPVAGAASLVAQPSPASPHRSTVIRAAVAAGWLLLLVIALTAGFGAFLAMLGLPLLVIGISAVLAGQARWAWLTNRPAGGAATVAGLLLFLVGTSVATPGERSEQAGTQITTTSRTTTTIPPPSHTTTIPPTTVVSPAAPPPAVLPPPPPSTTAAPPPAPTTTEEPERGNCHPSYPDVCIPPPPPDLDCGDIPHRNFRVLPPDPHRLDGRDNDGRGCETG